MDSIQKSARLDKMFLSKLVVFVDAPIASASAIKAAAAAMSEVMFKSRGGWSSRLNFIDAELVADPGERRYLQGKTAQSCLGFGITRRNNMIALITCLLVPKRVI